MSALIVGADRLGNIPKLLQEYGINEYIHWKGRKKGMRNKDIPQNVDMVIILYDFIEHRLTDRIKEESRMMDIPCIFSKRSVSDLSQKLNMCKDCNLCCKNRIN